MKLLYYTHRNLFVVVFLLMSLWGVFFYYVIVAEVMDETDDSLENTRELLVARFLAEPELLGDSQESWLKHYQVRSMSDEEAEDYDDRFYDGEMYVEIEDEDEPVRVMASCFRGADGRFYELKIWQSTLERDDLVEAIVTSLVVLLVVLLLCTSLATRAVLKSIFTPLNRIMEWIGNFVPGQACRPLTVRSRIREFRMLAEALSEMNRRGEAAYEQQKQFIENASHELQTPLAAIQGRLELLADTPGLDDKQLQCIDQAFRQLSRAVQLNKTLLMLSRIANGQYPDRTDVNLNHIVDDTLEMLSEVYADRQICFETDDAGSCCVRMNEMLARVLVGNLLKNAVVHNVRNGHVRVRITPAMLTVSNGGDTPLDPARIFIRFYHSTSGHTDSLGLGLSLVESIVNLYGFSLTYRFTEGEHVFVLKVVK